MTIRNKQYSDLNTGRGFILSASVHPLNKPKSSIDNPGSVARIANYSSAQLTESDNKTETSV